MIQVESGTNTKSKKRVLYFSPCLHFFIRIISGRVLDCLSDRVWFAIVNWVEMVSYLGKEFQCCSLWVRCKKVRVLGSLFPNCTFWGRSVGYDRVGFDFRTW